MNSYVFLSLTGFIVTFVMAIYVITLNYKSKTNRIFALFSLTLAIWNFGEMMLRIVVTARAATFWDLTASLLGWIFLGPLYLHFVLTFTKKDKVLENRGMMLLLYGPSLLWAGLKVFTNFLQAGVIKVYWGWDVIIAPGFYFYTIHLAILSAIGFYLLLTCWLMGGNKIIRYQARAALIGTFIPFSLGIVSDAILPMFGFHFVRLAGLFSTIYVLFFAYAILRYQFMQISPQRAASNIIATLPDPLLLLDSDLTINSLNPAAQKLLNYHENELIDKPIGILFPAQDKLWQSNDIKYLFKSGNSRTFDSELLTKDKTLIPVILSYSVVKDFSGEAIGVLMVAKDIREKKELIEKLEQSQAEIWQHSNQLNAILSNMREGIFIEDSNHEIKYMNHAALAILGDQIGNKCYSTSLGGSAENPVCSVPAIINRGEDRFNSIFESRDEKSIELIGSSLKNPDGSLSVLEIIRNITDKKKTEDELKKKVAELEEINQLAVGRELRMIELEKEIDQLLKELGREARYK
jgi:PAS domain S-box-containing protein